MEGLKKRSTIWKGFLFFFLFMWICTLISKSVYMSRLPRVSVALAEKKSIEHLVKAEGTIRQGKDVAIHTISGLRVEEIVARAGDQVQEGTVLFRLEKEDLQKAIGKKELEIAKLEHQIKVLEENSELEGEKKSQSIERSKEDLNHALNESEKKVNRASQELSQAEESLNRHLQNNVAVTPEEERLQKRTDYEQYITSVSEKENEITEKEAVIPELAKASEEAGIRKNEAAAKTEEAKEAVALAEGELGSAQTPQEQEAAQAKLDQAKQQLQQAEAEKQAADEKLNQAMELEESTKQQLTEAKSALEQLKSNPISEPDFSGEDSARQSWEAEKQAMEKQKQQAQYGVEDALTTKEEALLSANRNKEDADAREKGDSTLGIYRLELAQLKKELDEYKIIKKEEGKVAAAFEGTITEICVTTGEKTTEGAAVICADTSVPYQLEVLLDKNQKKYVEQGDEVTVKTGKKQEKLQIDFISENTDSPGSYRALIYLPEGMGSLGMNGEVQRSDVSDSYSCTIPADAIHKENERFYIYLLGEREGILGSELYVMKKYVDVLDQNEKYAALAEGSLTKTEKVITTSDKELKADLIVRLKDS